MLSTAYPYFDFVTHFFCILKIQIIVLSACFFFTSSFKFANIITAADVHRVCMNTCSVRQMLLRLVPLQ